MELLKRTVEEISDTLDREVMREAKAHFDNMLKPLGSLGQMEELLIKLAGIKKQVKPLLNNKVVIMMCADHGVYAEGFHSYPQEITKLIAELSGDKGKVASSVFSRFAGARMVTVDVGINTDVKGQHIINKKIKYGTANIAREPAMNREEAIKAIEAGIEVVANLVDEGLDLLAVGEAGICNTTSSAAIITLLTGCPILEVAGRGSGLNDEQYAQKIKIVEEAIRTNNPDTKDPLDILAKVGGLEIAGMVGCYLGAARYSVPVVIDGFISGVAALIAVKLAPECKKFFIPSHYSAEPGAKVVWQELGLKPFINLDMRLGEGTGALLAFSILECGIRVMHEMGTFS
ncbi:MAG: nicotinate-nucleotide--dimethylbenzimidazole phosphoribosyltransferase [Peptococcales bacterium]|jgi:nicotinate-nucleotide--dimethylbenzimidazole phosphoribosyltransferase